MTLGTYDTATLNRVVESLPAPATFLLDTFFPNVQTEENSEEIHFDVENDVRRVAPYVSPLVAGKVVEGKGFQTKSFKPAYVKDKRMLKADGPLKRSIGEPLGGNLSPMERRERRLMFEIDDQLEMLTRREEVQAAEALRDGTVTVTGEDYPTVVVDFGRDALLTNQLTLAARWGEADVSPKENIEQWATLVQTKSGAAARTVIMGGGASLLFKKDPEVREILDIRRQRGGSLELGPVGPGEGNDLAIFLGQLGQFEFWQYNDTYVDEAGVEQQLLDDYDVILGSPSRLEGYRAYGNILDEKANYKAERHFTKSWMEEDPAVRWLLMQSAPLMVPYRPNASGRWRVR